MTLLITVFAAVIASVKWYTAKDDSMKIGTLALIYWGAALMWTVDAVAEYIELGAEFFTPATEDMINDGFLGLAAVALGLIIWFVMLVIKDPKGRVKTALSRNS